MRNCKETLNKIQLLFSIMSDETRLKILLCLLDEGKCRCKCQALGKCSKCVCLSCMIEKNVNLIACETKSSQSLVSHQLKKMKEFNIVQSRKEGTTVFYSLKDGHIKELLSVASQHVEEDDYGKKII